MKTTSALFTTIITAAETTTAGIKRLGTSASDAIDVVDNVTSATRYQTEILRKWSKDLLDESNLNRDIKHQEMVVEAEIRASKVNDALQELMNIEKERPEGFSEFKQKFNEKVNKYFSSED